MITKDYIPITKEDKQKLDEYKERLEKENRSFDDSRVRIHAEMDKEG